MDQQRLRGLAALIVSPIFFSVMAVLTRLVAVSVSPVVVAFFRYGLGVLMVVIASRAMRLSLLGSRRGLLLLSGVTGAAASTCYFVALAHAPLANVAVLSCTFPIFSALFSHFVFGERLPLRAIPFVILPVVGVLMVAEMELAKLSLGAGEFFALMDGLFGGISVSLIRHLRRTESASSIFFYFVAVGLLITFPAFASEPFVPGAREAILLACVAATALFGRVTMNYCFRFYQAARGGVMMTFQVVIMAVVGALLFGEDLGIMGVAGSVLILGSCTYLVLEPSIKAEGAETALS